MLNGIISYLGLVSWTKLQTRLQNLVVEISPNTYKLREHRKVWICLHAHRASAVYRHRSIYTSFVLEFLARSFSPHGIMLEAFGNSGESLSRPPTESAVETSVQRRSRWSKRPCGPTSIRTWTDDAGLIETPRAWSSFTRSAAGNHFLRGGQLGAVRGTKYCFLIIIFLYSSNSLLISSLMSAMHTNIETPLSTLSHVLAYLSIKLYLRNLSQPKLLSQSATLYIIVGKFDGRIRVYFQHVWYFEPLLYMSEYNETYVYTNTCTKLSEEYFRFNLDLDLSCKSRTSFVDPACLQVRDFDSFTTNEFRVGLFLSIFGCTLLPSSRFSSGPKRGGGRCSLDATRFFLTDK